MPRISPASSQIEVVIVAAVVTFAAVRAFKKFVYDPYIAPTVDEAIAELSSVRWTPGTYFSVHEYYHDHDREDRESRQLRQRRAHA